MLIMDIIILYKMIYNCHGRSLMLQGKYDMQFLIKDFLKREWKPNKSSICQYATNAPELSVCCVLRFHCFCFFFKNSIEPVFGLNFEIMLMWSV